jgi:Zn-finger nucleic acid-binding protein
MNCPVCANNLTQLQAGTVTVDVCLGGCGGIWFDNFELQKLDAPHQPNVDMLVNLKRREDLPIDYDRRRNCPRCSNVVMMRHFFSPLRRVEVDECPSCGGYWLDAGELALIREERLGRPEQQAAVEAYLNAMTTEILDPMRSRGGEHATRAQKIAHLFKFSGPIQYRRE